jgi:hypothetical protein
MSKSGERKLCPNSRNQVRLRLAGRRREKSREPAGAPGAEAVGREDRGSSGHRDQGFQ